MNYSLPSESPDVGEIEVRIPLPAEEGWRDSLIEAGAPGAKREPDRAKPQLMVSRLKRFATLTTPSAPSLCSAHPPLLCEEGIGAYFRTYLFSAMPPVSDP